MKEMVGEVVLQWATNQSGSGESLEAWKKDVEQLDGYGTQHPTCTITLTVTLKHYDRNIKIIG